MKRRHATAVGRAGSVRVIGGRWRGTRLEVTDVDGLRPTGDRTRETLFNWLQPVLHGARCLDLFAGSGALGIEAVSRGAAQSVLVERDPLQARQLQAALARLDAGGAALSVHVGDALQWLAHARGTFDVVFLDPPFASEPWPRLWPLLGPLLSPEAWVYVESPAQSPPPPVPPHWREHRVLRTRHSRASLFHVAAPMADTLEGTTPPSQDTRS